jgi:hypothetical protein
VRMGQHGVSYDFVHGLASRPVATSFARPTISWSSGITA